MSTAVAEVRPAYGFLGSRKKSGGEHEDTEVVAVGKRRSDGFFIEEDEVEEEVLTESSSIGAPSPSCSSIGENSSLEAGGEEGEEEVESKLKEGDGLGCFDALEDSLPIKSGLSNFYSGKSKSFTSLAEATSTVAAAKELAKPENPFNKRRRILANWSRRASCSSLATATYLPPLLAPDHAVAEGEEGEEDDSDDDSDEYNHLPHRGKNVRDAPALPLPPPRLNANAQMDMARRNGLGTFRSPRSFSLSDLQNSTDT
ncbi:protein OXIDATIVE STRESS 3 LIKE 4-like [Phragmites australis]|uniref:protein OXIDATIVE STRESS 3 LIKE 4-like n=1 Tax=Phragmites australis TaxID=29695 RepID=UPI002D79A2D6|nr:protein OXIDATIVE STRESS 3 LIKE 4-like [Phragmites australis]